MSGSRHGYVVTGLRIPRLVLVVGIALMAVPLGSPHPATARITVGGGTADVGTQLRVAPVVVASGAPAGDLDWPVAGAVVAGFDPPPSPYAAGHRGVDLAVARGDVVAAMGDGTVGFAGMVAGRAWISVDHAGGLRTTVGPMATVTVAAGDAVGAGDVVGTAAATAHATAAEPRTGRLHVSARVAGDYVDPATLVGPLVATLLERSDGGDG